MPALYSLIGDGTDILWHGMAFRLSLLFINNLVIISMFISICAIGLK